MRKVAVAVGAVTVLLVGGVAFAQTTGDERIYPASTTVTGR
jgi:hypothetical protein